jgi:hypothetical protein
VLRVPRIRAARANCTPWPSARTAAIALGLHRTGGSDDQHLPPRPRQRAYWGESRVPNGQSSCLLPDGRHLAAALGGKRDSDLLGQRSVGEVARARTIKTRAIASTSIARAVWSPRALTASSASTARAFAGWGCPRGAGGTRTVFRALLARWAADRRGIPGPHGRERGRGRRPGSCTPWISAVWAAGSVQCRLVGRWPNALCRGRRPASPRGARDPCLDAAGARADAGVAGRDEHGHGPAGAAEGPSGVRCGRPRLGSSTPEASWSSSTPRRSWISARPGTSTRSASRPQATWSSFLWTRGERAGGSSSWLGLISGRGRSNATSHPRPVSAPQRGASNARLGGQPSPRWAAGRSS